MKRRKTLFFKDPQKKYNIGLDAATDFIASPYPELSGEQTKDIPVQWLDFKYLYIPSSVIRVYLLKDSYLIPVVHNVITPLNKVNKIVLVRPTGMTSAYIYFQYWLTNLLSVKIYDEYNGNNFTLTHGDIQITNIPFPTYNLKVLLELGSNPTNINYQVNISPFDGGTHFILDAKTGITELIINNFYKFSELGGSGAITEPHYIFPSFRTQIYLTNADPEVDITGCYLKVISWFGEL